MSPKDKFRLNKFVREVNRNMADFDDEREPERGEASDSHTDLKPPLKTSSSNGKGKAFDRPPSYMSATTPLETQFPSHPFPQAYRDPSPAPLPPRDHSRDDERRHRRRAGIWMPWSLFILLALMLFLESTVLFTYTVIGLYNNTPVSAFAWAGVGVQPNGMTIPAGSSACKQLEELTTAPQPQQPAVNFAPNFVLPQAAPAAVAPPSQVQQLPPAVVTVTVSHDSDRYYSDLLLSKLLATPTTTSTFATSSTDPTSAAAALASEVASLLKNATGGDANVKTVTAPVPIVLTTATATPTASLTTAIEMLTVDMNGHTLSPSSTPSSSPSPSSTGNSSETNKSAPASSSSPSSATAAGSSSNSSAVTSTPTSSAPPPPPPPATVTTVVPPPSSPPATSAHATAASPTPSAKAKGSECPENIWLVSAICARMVG